MKKLLTQSPLKLHLGCGDVHIPGFVNVDIQDGYGVDLVADARDLSMVDDGCVDLIYASHLLEHFKRDKIEDVIKEWRRVLKEGSVLRLAVPDFEAIVKWYEQHGLTDVIGLLYGGQEGSFDFHNIAFDFDSLGLVVLNSGFRHFKKYDWREVEHSDIDDYSQAYLPHMDKENGMLMSLNVEAVKA